MINNLRSRIASYLTKSHRGDLLAVGFIGFCAFCYLAPAVSSGFGFGPADLGRGLSVLTSVAHNQVHNNINGDIIDQGVAWNTLNYNLIHHGQFPLWNSYSGNGLPQFLNFESAVLALPSLVGYLVPLSISFTVTVLVKLLIAGLGTYWCARLLRLRVIPSTFAGVTFMLSGSFANWLGWSISGVVCWTGVIFGALVLCYRAKSVIAPVSVLAVSVAFAIYGGFPEGYILQAGTFILILGVIAVVLGVSRRSLSVRPVLLILAGCLFGLGLSAPLWLPGLEVIRASVRAGTYAAQGIPIHGILLALAQGYDGLPTQGSAFFLGHTNYFESAAYIGVIAVVLAGVAVICLAIRRRHRHPVVIALALTGVAQLLVIYQAGTHTPVQRLIRGVGLGSIATHRLLPILAFVLALLAAFGLNEIMRARRGRVVGPALLLSTVLVGVVIVYMWSTVPQAALSSCATPSPGGAALGGSVCESIRRTSLYGPSAILLALLTIAIGSVWVNRKRRALIVEGGQSLNHPLPRWISPVIPIGLLAVQAGSLIFAGAGVNTFSRTYFPKTQAINQLAKATHGDLVAQDGPNVTCPAIVTAACGVRQPTGIDLYPNINIGYGIDELGLHDPIIPKATFADWPVANAGQLIAATNLFNPSVNSVALARAYGVSYVLVPRSVRPPQGMRKVSTLTNNGTTIDLYRVPESAKIMRLVGANVTDIATPSNRTVTATLVGRGATELVAHITDVPGWQASVDGTKVEVTRGPTNDLIVHVPSSALRSGHAQLDLSYLPSKFLASLVLLMISILGLCLVWIVERRRTRPLA